MLKVIFITLSIGLFPCSENALANPPQEIKVCDISQMRCPAGIDLDTCSCAEEQRKFCDTSALRCSYGINYKKCECRIPKKEKGLK